MTVRELARRTRHAAAIAAWLAAGGWTHAIEARAQETGAPDAALYRIFLRDGSTLVSYGDFAHVADRVVMSIPVGGTDAAPELHLLTIAQTDVDWERTNAYAHAVRAGRYAETRGEADFAAVSREVAGALNDVAFVSDPAKRLALVEGARRKLIEWPEQHYGYRAEEMLQMAAWLDGVVSEFRIAAGRSTFDLALVARAVPAAPAVTLLPPPGLRERVESSLNAARRTPDPAERVSLLRAVLGALEQTGADAAWAGPLRARVSADVEAELAIDRAYGALTTSALARADWFARRANVRGLSDVVQSVLQADTKMRHARPAAVAALLATLDARMDAARRLRLARDAWQLRAELLREYWRTVRQGLDRLLGVRVWLADIEQLAGPAPRSVRRLGEVSDRAARELGLVKAPAEVASAHATLIAAAGLASRAAAARLDAMRSGQMDAAWQASSAAAGALMLIDQAVEELRRVTRAPRP